jgi:Cu(I)/Ag(I) efflux system periplasmic protein CusF
MTKRTVVTAALVLSVGASSLTVLAQSDEFVNGQVTKIDESAGKITIKHGPLKKFDMNENMTMVFRAGDPAMLKAVKPGDRVRFVPDRVKGQFTVTKIEKIIMHLRLAGTQRRWPVDRRHRAAYPFRSSAAFASTPMPAFAPTAARAPRAATRRRRRGA